MLRRRDAATNSGDRSHRRPTGLAILAALTAVVMGGQANAAVAPGSVLVMGSNQFGQLGIAAHSGTSEPTSPPALLTLPGQTGEVIDIAAGEAHTLVLTSSGQVYAFGSNEFGQLGVPANSGTTVPNPTPALVSLPATAGKPTMVAAGRSHSLIATSSGRIFAFGYGFYGQLGDDPNALRFSPNPTPLEVVLPNSAGSLVAIEAGAGFSAVLTSTGQLYTFGSNASGELGRTQNLVDNPIPTPVEFPGLIGQVIDVSLGAGHVIARSSADQLFAFGTDAGQLGIGSISPVPHPNPTLITLPGAVSAAADSAGGATHTLVRTTSGQIYTFGSNRWGELGTAVDAGTFNAQGTPAKVFVLGRAIASAAGDHFSAVVLSTGEVLTFGHNNRGQLGRPSSDPLAPDPALLPMTLGSGVFGQRVFTGSMAAHALVLTSRFAITSTQLPDGFAGTPFRVELTSAGGAAPVRWRSETSLSGTRMVLDPGSGILSGTSSFSLDRSLRVVAVDALGQERVVKLTLRIAPQIRAFRQLRSVWRAGRPSTGVSGKVPLGTQFTIVTGERALIRLSFSRKTLGRLVGGRCVAPNAGNNAKRACTRLVAAGELTVNSRQPQTGVAFRGRLTNGNRLRPGRYRVAATAFASGSWSRPRMLWFTLKPG